MQIRQSFNVNMGEVEKRGRDIFVPICLWNKFFSEKGVLSQNVKEYLDWALGATKENVLFFVVDRIQDTNFLVRSGKSERSSITHVLREGEILRDALIELIKTLPEEKRQKVDVIRWEDYQKSDPFWAHITHTVYKEFKNNPSFRDAVLNCVKTSVRDREFSEEQYLRLCDYVLDEFCVAYSGVTYKGTHYGLYVYPFTDSVLEFIEGIKSGDIFPDIKDKLPSVTGVILMN